VLITMIINGETRTEEARGRKGKGVTDAEWEEDVREARERRESLKAEYARTHPGPWWWYAPGCPPAAKASAQAA